MAYQWRSNPNRDAVTRLRSLAGEKGYRVEKAPIRGSWFLVDEVTSELAVSDKERQRFRQSARSRSSSECQNVPKRRMQYCRANHRPA
jgi:hypothetical protein